MEVSVPLKTMLFVLFAVVSRRKPKTRRPRALRSAFSARCHELVMLPYYGCSITWRTKWTAHRHLMAR